MRDRPARGGNWHEWEDSDVWNLLIVIGFLLGFSLILIPMIQMILEEPSFRPPALVLGIGLLALVILLVTFPREYRKRWPWPEEVRRVPTPTSAIHSAAEGSQEGKVGAIIELRSAMRMRLQKRRHLMEQDLRKVIQSPTRLRTVMDDEVLEQLLLEDPRYLAHHLDRDGEFLNRFEDLLTRAEGWR